MRLNVVMAVMYVMGRFGVWRPYLVFIDRVLNLLDTACEEEFGPMWQDSMPDMEVLRQ